MPLLPRRVTPSACRPFTPRLAVIALAVVAIVSPFLRAAETPSVEDRLRQLEARLSTLEQENASLRRELGRPAPPPPALPASPAPSVSPSDSRPAATASASPLSLRLTGDFRSRFSSVMYTAPEAVTRDQLLFQARVGFVAQVSDTLEGGLRFTAGDLNTTFGGSPLSAQFASADNASRKQAYFDQLYFRWKPDLGADASAVFTLGKSANPFYVPSRMLFDNDYNPEGASEEFTFTLAPEHHVYLAAGQYVLDDIVGSSRDPLLLAARARWDAQWQSSWSTTLGLSHLVITHPDGLNATNIANNERGNTRTAAGVLVHNYRPWVAEASISRLFDHVPGYAGKFPVTFGAEFLRNPGAPAQRDAWSTALTLGRSGKAGQWELGYRYVRVEADAWFEEMLEGDYGAFYRTVPPGWNTDPTSLAGGPANGSNTRSHVFRSSYSPRDYLLFSANLFLNDLAHRPPGNASDTGARRVQVETLLRF